MKALLCAGMLALAATVSAADETKLGAGVTLKEATPIQSILDKPADFVGKTVRIDGTATAVCEEMGCWLAVSTGEGPDAKTIRLKVEHGAGIVFPISAKGKQVSAEGVFEKVSTAEDKEAAGEHAKHEAAAKQDPKMKHDPKTPHAAPSEHDAKHAEHTSAAYQIKATGAVIK